MVELRGGSPSALYQKIFIWLVRVFVLHLWKMPRWRSFLGTIYKHQLRRACVFRFWRWRWQSVTAWLSITLSQVIHYSWYPGSPLLIIHYSESDSDAENNDSEKERAITVGSLAGSSQPHIIDVWLCAGARRALPPSCALISSNQPDAFCLLLNSYFLLSLHDLRRA